MICEFCGRIFPKIKKRGIEHINISQKAQRHVFCSPKCRKDWCLHIQKHPVGVIFSWSIGCSNNEFFFIKKNAIIRYPPYVGTRLKYSYFDYSLSEIKEMLVRDKYKFAPWTREILKWYLKLHSQVEVISTD